MLSVGSVRLPRKPIIRIFGVVSSEFRALAGAVFHGAQGAGRCQWLYVQDSAS